MSTSESFRSKEQFNMAIALAREVKHYMDHNAEDLNGDVWDNLTFWRSGILSQGMIDDENLSELIDYIGVEKVQELVQIASNNLMNEDH